MSEWVKLNRSICTSEGTWIPKGSLVYVVNIIGAWTIGNGLNKNGTHANVIYNDIKLIIYFDNDLTERWTLIKNNRLLNLVL